MRDEAVAFCRTHHMIARKFEATVLGWGSFYGCEYEEQIDPKADYVDLAFFFDATALGFKEKPTVLRKTDAAAGGEERVPVWQGFLYVFLKIPD